MCLNISENTAICSQHSWHETSKDKLITVCTICNNCSEYGSSCVYNGIMGAKYRACECRTQQACCTHCGICRRCAEAFWVNYLNGNFVIIICQMLKLNLSYTFTFKRFKLCFPCMFYHHIKFTFSWVIALCLI